jgi:hypothetical protein
MNWAITWILLALVTGLMLEGLVRQERAYQLPFLGAVMTFAFILPQMPGVADDPFLPQGGYVKVCVMAILALLFLRLGWSEHRKPLALFNQTYSESRLLILAGILSAIGSVFYVKISHLPGEAVIGVQMTGAPVMYLFFARLLNYGLAIAVLCFARRPSLAAGAIVVFDIVLCLERILVTGKRAEALELVLIGALALWFHRRWTIPRSALLAGILLGTIGMSSMADYREITRQNASFEWDSIQRIDIMANFQQLMKSGGPELRNAVYRIDHIDRDQDFDYGAVHWNQLVFNYVPAQLFGRGIKDALRLPMPPPARDYQPSTGTTETGMVDAFQSFWYFGALKFLLLSYLMSRLWASASAGSTTAQIVYIFSIVPAMHAVSHVTDWVVSVWVHMALFLVPVLIFAAVRGNAAGRPAARQGTGHTGLYLVRGAS